MMSGSFEIMCQSQPRLRGDEAPRRRSEAAWDRRDSQQTILEGAVRVIGGWLWSTSRVRNQFNIPPVAHLVLARHRGCENALSNRRYAAKELKMNTFWNLEELHKLRLLARDLRRDAQQHALPLSGSIQTMLDAIVCEWKGEEIDLSEAQNAAAVWLQQGCMNYQAAHCSNPSGSALVCAKAWAIESHCLHLITLCETSVVQVAIASENAKTALLLLWNHLCPANAGWSNEQTRQALREVVTMLES